MLELYNAPQSTCSQKVRLVLAEKSLVFVEHKLKLFQNDQLKPEYLKLNPNGRMHRSFSLGFPNLYAQAHGRTGSFLMVHGGCASIGCYAVTDPAVRRRDVEHFVEDPANAGRWFRDRYAVSHTSGSQGQPLLILQDRRCLELAFALQLTRGNVACKSVVAEAVRRFIRPGRLAVLGSLS